MRYLSFFDGQSFNCLKLDDLDERQAQAYVEAVRDCEIPYSITSRADLQSPVTVEESLEKETLALIAEIAYKVLAKRKGVVRGTLLNP
jgi:hypothetical protein